MRLHLSRKRKPSLTFSILKPFLQHYSFLFNYYQCLIIYVNFCTIFKTSYCYLGCIIRSEKISYLLKFLVFSTQRYTHYKLVNWCSSAICCHGKGSSHIATSKVIRSGSYGYKSLKTSNAFQSSLSN